MGELFLAGITGMSIKVNLVVKKMVSEMDFRFFSDSGISAFDYGAAEKWFPT